MLEQHKWGMLTFVQTTFINKQGELGPKVVYESSHFWDTFNEKNGHLYMISYRI